MLSTGLYGEPTARQEPDGMGTGSIRESLRDDRNADPAGSGRFSGEHDGPIGWEVGPANRGTSGAAPRSNLLVGERRTQVTRKAFPLRIVGLCVVVSECRLLGPERSATLLLRADARDRRAHERIVTLRHGSGRAPWEAPGMRHAQGVAMAHVDSPSSAARGHSRVAQTRAPGVLRPSRVFRRFRLKLPGREGVRTTALALTLVLVYGCGTCGPEPPPLAPLTQQVGSGARVIQSGVERWAYVLRGGNELRFRGDPFARCDLVWTAAVLSPRVADTPILSVSWKTDGRDETELLQWPRGMTEGDTWTEFRVPLNRAGLGEAVFRLLPNRAHCDSVAIVSPRFETTSWRSDPRGNRFNIVLIVLDTFRFDHVSRYGSMTTRTPNIDLFLANAVEFMDAYARATFTLPSHVTMMTGLTPRSHGVRRNDQVLDVSVTTVPQLLYQAGYRTGAFFRIPALQEPAGFPSGFDVYAKCPEGLGRIPNSVSGWLQTMRRQDPFFLFANLAMVHLVRAVPGDVWQLSCGFSHGPQHRLPADRSPECVTLVLPPGTSALHFTAQRGSLSRPHLDRSPLRMAMWNWRVTPEKGVTLTWDSDVERPGHVKYAVPPQQPSNDVVVFSGSTDLRICNSSQDTTVVTLSFRAHPDFSRVLEQDKAQYALATSSLDEVLGELVSTVERFSDPERTAWILTSDHGEGLEDHRERLHGHEVFEETAHAVLGIRLPGREAASVSGVVPLDVIAPTMLRLAGLPVPPGIYQQTLLDLPWRSPRSVVSEAFDLRRAADVIPTPETRSIRTGEWSLVLDGPDGEARLYDRTADRAETKDLAPLFPQVVDSLSAMLDRAAREHSASCVPGVVSDDPELREALRALGYAQ